MQKLLTTRLIRAELTAAAALWVVMAGSAAIAQPAGGAGSPKAANQPQMTHEAPVGHRQPRADQVTSEKNPGDANDLIDKEDAALNRKIKSICRGC